jgi:hypothetical protein
VLARREHVGQPAWTAEKTWNLKDLQAIVTWARTGQGPHGDKATPTRPPMPTKKAELLQLFVQEWPRVRDSLMAAVNARVAAPPAPVATAGAGAAAVATAPINTATVAAHAAVAAIAAPGENQPNADTRFRAATAALASCQDATTAQLRELQRLVRAVIQARGADPLR